MNISKLPRAYRLWWQLNYAVEHFEAGLGYIVRDGDFEAARDALAAAGMTGEREELFEPEFAGGEEQPVLFKHDRRFDAPVKCGEKRRAG